MVGDVLIMPAKRKHRATGRQASPRPALPRQPRPYRAPRVPRSRDYGHDIMDLTKMGLAGTVGIGLTSVVASTIPKSP